MTIVDEAELRSQTFGDHELLRDVVSLFLQQTPSLVAALEASGSAARAEIAHRLKGSALALGARALADIASRIEMQPDDSAPLAEARRIAEETGAALRAIAAGAG